LPDHQIWELVTRTLKGWNAPGHDGICGFWWKKFRRASDRLKEILWGWMEVNAPDIPAWFVGGEQCLSPRRGVRVDLSSIDP